MKIKNISLKDRKLVFEGESITFDENGVAEVSKNIGESLLALGGYTETDGKTKVAETVDVEVATEVGPRAEEPVLVESPTVEKYADYNNEVAETVHYDEPEVEQVTYTRDSLEGLNRLLDEKDTEYDPQAETSEQLATLGEELQNEAQANNEDLNSHTVPELKEMLEERGIEYDSKAKKADLIELLK